MNFKKFGKVLTSKFVGTGPSSYEKKKMYQAAVWQRLRNTALGNLAKLRKANISFVMSVCLSVSTWNPLALTRRIVVKFDFFKMIFRKSYVEKFKVLLNIWEE